MSKEEPEIVRLMDATGTVVLDSVAAEYEDSFCLESFGESIRMAETTEPKGTKHFIIARVQTWDHKQPDRAFYSYYHAHHLNKLLFQTQVYLEKKLIHRLHVLNPLTNTDIIGNVLYFMVIGKSRRNRLGQIVRVPNSEQAPSMMRAADASNDIVVTTEDIRLDTAALAVPPSPSVSKLPSFSDPIQLNRAIHNNQGPESITEEDEEENDKYEGLPTPVSAKSQNDNISMVGWTRTGAVCAEGDDLTDIQPTQQKQRRNSTARNVVAAVSRRLSTTAQKTKGFVPVDDESDGGQEDGHVMIDLGRPRLNKGPKNALRVTTSISAPSAVGPRSAFIPSKVGIASPISSTMNQPPMSAYARTTFENDGLMSPTSASRIKNQTQVPAGNITQRGERITPIQALAIVPPSSRSRRRSLSYMNSVQTSGSTSASIDDWKRMYKLDKAQIVSAKSQEQDKLDQAAGKFDEVKPIESEGNLVDVMAGSPPPVVKEDVFYDAILVATDNDFLESSRIRSVFKENAVISSDAVLFEMPPYTGEQRITRGPNNYEDSPLPCDMCFPTDEHLRNSTPLVRLLHECKCYLLLIVLTIGKFSS